MNGDYTQPVKGLSRKLLWRHAVSTLTTERDEARILQLGEFVEAWEYCNSVLRQAGLTKGLDPSQLRSWLDFADSRYGRRYPSDLRVAYLCGPEPENDMRILVELGVRIENVWAVEEGSQVHERALENARNTFPALKIFRGYFDRFIRVVRERFDIVYLDFTSPLASPKGRPYATLHKVFDEQALSELSALIVNVSEPNIDEDNLDFLADYFLRQPYIENTAAGLQDESDPSSTWYVETFPDQWSTRDELTHDIRNRFGEFYSSFCSQYPALYANRVQPAFRLLRVADARRNLFAESTKVYETAIAAATDFDALVRLFTGGGLPNREEGWGPGMDVLLMPEKFPLWSFLQRLRERRASKGLVRKWLAEYEDKVTSLDSDSYKTSRWDAVRLSDLLWNITEGYLPLASECSLQALVGAYRNLPDRKIPIFCDLPMLHLLTELALNQFGYPHHPVLAKQWRATYTAKQNPMYLDVHVLDQCRPMYDSLPALRLYPEHFGVLEKQMLTRVGLSAIQRQTYGIVPDLYWASALASRSPSGWSSWISPKPRISLTA
jgi:hypothetical protein